MAEVVPELQPPGAGLPWWQHYGGRHVFFPMYSTLLSWDAADILFNALATRVTDLVSKIDDARFRERVLVDGVIGIEDDSRYWSASMVLEHLAIVHGEICELLIAAEKGEDINKTVRIQDVKPTGDLDRAKAVIAFQSSVEKYTLTAAASGQARSSKTVLAHPWFGELTAHQWHCLAALHEGIHLWQLQKIANQLS